jgi:type IV fimbrial biogenesis protein FimT
VTFNGLGSVLGAMQINVSNPSGGACRTAAGSEPMRCLQVVVSASGSVRMCDPAVTEDGDPRKC